MNVLYSAEKSVAFHALLPNADILLSYLRAVQPNGSPFSLFEVHLRPLEHSMHHKRADEYSSEYNEATKIK